MVRKIKISTEEFEAKAEMLEDDRPETCQKIWDSLPLKGKASVFKEEIYFNIPVDIPPEDASSETESGDISYWPEGPAFCVFYGESQPVSPVTTFARVKEDLEKFRDIDRGDEIIVRKAD